MLAVAVERATDFAADLVVEQLEPPIGAQISGIDLRQPLTAAQRDAIKALLLKHRVLFFRDQPITGEQQLALARQFGKVYEHPTTRRVEHRVKADSAQSHRISATIAKQEYKITSGTWHTDTELAGPAGMGGHPAHRRHPAARRRYGVRDGHAVYQGLSEETKEEDRESACGA